MKRIGRYEVEQEIGRGAMGVVYLAHDPRVRRRLAVKTCELPQGIDPEVAREYRERFIREAQSAGALNHPAIVTVYDVDEGEAGSSYIAMEYVPGNTLQDCLQNAGRLDPKRAIHLGVTIAGALQVAHTAGIVHRDVKPANILVRVPDGVFKIADFGIARLSKSELTQADLAVGSPAYMSPEQLRCLEMDGRSDLFSLAAVLYEALSGTRPFEGEDLPSLAYAVVHENPTPISYLVRGLPPSLDGFFARALAKAANDRYQDGDSFAEALQSAWERRTEQPSANAGLEPAARVGKLPPASTNSGTAQGSGSAPDAGESGTSQSQAQGLGPEDTQPLEDSRPAAPETESRPRGYRPRSPARVLQRVRVEQPLTEVDIIPLARRDRSGGNAVSGSGRRRPGRMVAETETAYSGPRRRMPGLPSFHRSLVILLLVAASLAAASLQLNKPPPALGSVVLQIESSLPAGTLSVLIDGDLQYVGGLSAAADGSGTPGARSTSLARRTITVEPGEHVIQVQVKPDGGARSYQEQVTVHVNSGASHRLVIDTGPADNPVPTLEFQ